MSTQHTLDTDIVKVTLSKENAGERLKEIMDFLDLNRVEFAKKLNVTTATISNILSHERLISVDMIIRLMNLGVSMIYIYYGLGSPIDERYNQFLESYNPQKDQESQIPLYLEEYIIVTLKRQHKLERNFINLFFPISEFITRSLKHIEYEQTHALTIDNARDRLIAHLKKIKMSLLFDSEAKRQKVIKHVKEEYSKVEVYVLLKNYTLFI